ncbi:BMP family lipoprotein [Anaerosphaera multitolerans]|uniref:BMP family ABC transporter substrate-binding protein n=1 Tax=Anaerosphaera multitolerans TaxID=2487351 RepID=A0A437S836_9FIRM|nr:BMP family ABC transporter substrate-binding protein [Anaerosphaera multitolerans]RVU55249.1 BMP family ABC transporter substrate-binding protein [Anaerosphaera multitolerans]
MKKRNSLIALILVLTLVLVACGGNNGKAPANEGEEKTDAETALKIGFVTDEGGINDQSFNQGVWEGIEKAEAELGIENKYMESTDANDYKPNFETLIDEGMEVIIGAGFKMGDTIVEEAKLNPELKFAIVDVDPTAGFDEEENPITVEAPENLLGIMFKQEEPSFLVGYIAALTTETNKVGFVGGQESGIISGFEYGYKAGVDYGAKELGKEIEIMSQYVGNFSDVQKGKAITNQMYQQGADIVFHAAGGAGDGVIEAAKEQDKWAIGVDKDQSEMAPDNVLTSAMKNANVAIYDLIESLVNGEEFEGGTTIYLGLKDQGAVGIAPTSDTHVPQEILDKVKEIEEKIISGEIVVPANEEDYNKN